MRNVPKTSICFDAEAEDRFYTEFPPHSNYLRSYFRPRSEKAEGGGVKLALKLPQFSSRGRTRHSFPALLLELSPSNSPSCLFLSAKFICFLNAAQISHTANDFVVPPNIDQMRSIELYAKFTFIVRAHVYPLYSLTVRHKHPTERKSC